MQKILIVDDDTHMRALVKTYAEIEGYLCFEAADGKETLEKLTNHSFDLILLDVMMPGKDGFQTLSEIRGSCNTPVIMITARKEEYTNSLASISVPMIILPSHLALKS